MYERGLSFCIPVYGTKDHVTRLVDSITAQTALKNGEVNYEILLGCDGDADALPVLRKIREDNDRIRVFHDPVNRGKFITENTLAAVSRYSSIIFIDSDDALADTDAVTVLIHKYDGRYDITAFSFRNMRGDGTDAGEQRVSGGNFMVKRSVFMAMNGFYPWRCRADGPFHTRAGRLGYTVAVTEEILISRLLREDSLLHCSAYGANSSKRREYRRMHIQNLERGEYICPVFNVNSNMVELI
ncbi:MAG: glycosyltransferase family A protein [Sulfurimonas sp.]|jgi:glycosyltransferase involved in cell wall biosynthesis|uniref:glycosyltransferase n=1 Tax=Sulfurimonas sp. TaxID=2022749 RepID=UPI00356300DC